MLRSLIETLMRLSRAARKGRGVVYMTEQELEAEMARVAQELGVSLDEALKKLDRGELDGTTAEVRLRMLRYLRHPEDEIRPRAAA